MKPVQKSDKTTIRELAKRIAEIAALPIQTERIRLWKSLNALKPERPMIVHNAAHTAEEICPESSLQCEEDSLRRLERALKLKIARHELAHDDYPITVEFRVGWVIHNSGNGVKEVYTRRDSGGFAWDPPIKKYTDIKKLKPSVIEVDREASDGRMEHMQELFGDILHVQRGGIDFFRAKLTRRLILLRGFNQFLLDLYDAPEFVHEIIGFLRDDMIREIEYYERENLFCLNNGPEDWTNCGGMAANDDLPGENFDPNHVHMNDMFVWGESQESVNIGPRQFNEFVLRKQLPILKRFGLVAYGCCEMLDDKVDLLMQNIPKLRWVAVPPWSNRELMAEKLQNRYVYSYKPQPSRICQPNPDFPAAEKELRETLNMARGCCIAIDLKDTGTFCGEVERLTTWTDMAQRVVEEEASALHLY